MNNNAPTFSTPSYGNRIVYTKSGVPNVLTSNEMFGLYVGGTLKQYRPYVDLNSNKWFIREETTSTIVLQGTGTSKHKLMIKAKSALKTLGIKFEEESRAKKKNNQATTEVE